MMNIHALSLMLTVDSVGNYDRYYHEQPTNVYICIYIHMIEFAIQRFKRRYNSQDLSCICGNKRPLRLKMPHNKFMPYP